ncbi:hypothetical protein X975_23004, partial [Stegodyphus mimosarum]
MESITGKQKQGLATKPTKVKQKYIARDYKGMSKDDLRQELRKRGIKISGKKADLFPSFEEEYTYLWKN